MDKDGVIASFKGELIVSCQAEAGDPFNKPHNVALFAIAAQMAGAKGIRSEGVEKIKCIKQSFNLPMIGLIKSKFADGSVRITGTMEDVEQLVAIGCDIIAIDGTFRLREGLTGPQFINMVKRRCNAIVLADIATYDEAMACQSAGADCISTALNGYTPETKEETDVDFSLISQLSADLSIPLIAEGKINTPQLAGKAMKCGAHCVIVGTAITRPRVVTSWFVKEVKNNKITK